MQCPEGFNLAEQGRASVTSFYRGEGMPPTQPLRNPGSFHCATPPSSRQGSARCAWEPAPVFVDTVLWEHSHAYFFICYPRLLLPSNVCTEEL